MLENPSHSCWLGSDEFNLIQSRLSASIAAGKGCSLSAFKVLASPLWERPVARHSPCLTLSATCTVDPEIASCSSRCRETKNQSLVVVTPANPINNWMMINLTTISAGSVNLSTKWVWLISAVWFETGIFCTRTCMGLLQYWYSSHEPRGSCRQSWFS